MSRLRVHNVALSLDGYGVGEGISEEQPFGHAGAACNVTHLIADRHDDREDRHA